MKDMTEEDSLLLQMVICWSFDEETACRSVLSSLVARR